MGCVGLDCRSTTHEPLSQGETELLLLLAREPADEAVHKLLERVVEHTPANVTGML